MAPINPFPISASLTLRMAEAADGFRGSNNNRQLYLVANIEFPHDVIPFESLTQANDYYNNLPDPTNLAIYGPFVTNNEFPLKFDNTVVNKIVVQIEFQDPQINPESIELSGKTDAIFFNLSSLDKFLMPYYAKLFGVSHAKTIRDNLIKDAKTIGSKVIVYSHENVTNSFSKESQSQ